jgi:hypothetical protein
MVNKRIHLTFSLGMANEQSLRSKRTFFYVNEVSILQTIIGFERAKKEKHNPYRTFKPAQLNLLRVD